VTRCWRSVDDVIKIHYLSYLDSLMENVVIPKELHHCLVSGRICDDCSHWVSVSDYYKQILLCVEAAVNAYIPLKTSVSASWCVPGWNDFVQDKHIAARNAYLEWLHSGKPRCGHLFQHMQRTRANFKLALSYCKQELQLRADAHASSLRDKNPVKFWQSVREDSNSRTTKYVDTVGDVTGEKIYQRCGKNTFKGYIIMLIVILMQLCIRMFCLILIPIVNSLFVWQRL